MFCNCLQQRGSGEFKLVIFSFEDRVLEPEPKCQVVLMVPAVSGANLVLHLVIFSCSPGLDVQYFIAYSASSSFYFIFFFLSLSPSQVCLSSRSKIAKINDFDDNSCHFKVMGFLCFIKQNTKEISTPRFFFPRRQLLRSFILTD